MTGGASSFHRNVIVLLLSVATLLRVAVAADFAVLHPTTGDTLTVGVRFNITWTNNSQSDVTISLLKEEPVGNRSLVYILASNIPNNGTWRWNLDSSTYDEIESGCNYLMEMRAGETITSGFFTMLNPEDGGLPANASCSTATSSTPSGPSSSCSCNSSSISPGTLAGALAGTAAAIILLHALVFFIGRSRNWFVPAALISDLVRRDLNYELSRMRGVDNNYLAVQHVDSKGGTGLHGAVQELPD